jgi:MFS transporter, DHA2 family, multidrug resistance protein
MSETIQAKATFKQWIAVIGSLLGAFMAILDISITNASLQDIQGGLNATLDEGAWISTAYLVAEIIVIPLTGWLTQVFGLRRYLLWSAAVFIVASMLCGTSQSLNEMIFFRIIQGFSGGVLIPLSATIILTNLPVSQRPLGLALFSLSATFAPCIGPTIGGWLTVNYAWPYIFYINLVPGILLMLLIGYGMEKSPMKLELLGHGDWWGIASMGTALGSLTVILEEGVRKDWFGSDYLSDPPLRFSRGSFSGGGNPQPETFYQYPAVTAAELFIGESGGSGFWIRHLRLHFYPAALFGAD